MDENQTRFPQYLDDPKPFLLWTVDELAPFGVWLGIGIVTGNLLLCLIASYVWILVWRRFRDNLPSGFLMHYLYWCGVPMKGRAWVNPFHKEVRGP